MKDKEMIEEMAKEIAKRDCYFYDKCNRKPKHNCISLDPKIRLDSDKNYVTIATWLVNAGYRKIDKDSVVLTKEELQEHDKKLTNDIITMFQKLAQNWASADIVNDTAKRLRKLYEV